jgi:hypothetical protein
MPPRREDRPQEGTGGARRTTGLRQYGRRTGLPPRSLAVALLGTAILFWTPSTIAQGGFESALRYTNIVRTAPRPLRIHVLEARVGPGGLAAAALICRDPDGPGPAEASLTSPLATASNAGVVAAINANVASMLVPPGETNAVFHGWTNAMPVTIGGWARHGGATRSGPSEHYAPVWIGADGRVHPGDTNVPPDAPEAVAGFTVILRRGEVVHPPGARAAALHPRSAVGADETGRRIWLVVVDGRRSGYSEGMTEAELGALLKELGASEAVNLDGGGSSILLYDADGRGLRVMNRPSDGRPRPVPVLLGLLKPRPDSDPPPGRTPPP